MKTLFFLFIATFTFGQGLTVDRVVVLNSEKARSVDRHMKTMINMIHEIDFLESQNKNYETGFKLLDQKMIAQAKEIGYLNNSVMFYKEREEELVDTANYYKVKNLASEFKVVGLNDRIENLEKSNNKKDWIIIGLNTAAGILLGALIF